MPASQERCFQEWYGIQLKVRIENIAYVCHACFCRSFVETEVLWYVKRARAQRKENQKE